ncbi:MAG: PilN domain-containing protein [Wenzhouxiangella sp.]
MAKINLLPWRENLRKQRQKNFMVALGFAVAFAVGVVLLTNHTFNQLISGQDDRNNYLRSEIRKLERDIQRIEELEVTRDNLIARKDVIERLQINRSMMVHLFNQMAQTAPEGVTLNSVRQANEQLTIVGTSESETRVSDYMRNIEGAAWLHRPTLRIVERVDRDARPGQPYRFELGARISAPETVEEEY